MTSLLLNSCFPPGVYPKDRRTLNGARVITTLIDVGAIIAILVIGGQGLAATGGLSSVKNWMLFGFGTAGVVYLAIASLKTRVPPVHSQKSVFSRTEQE